MEFLLSSTASTSSLPSTTLHSLATGANIFQFKSPNNSTNPNQAVEKDVKEKDSIIRQTMGYVQGSDGVGGAIIGLGGKEGRAGLNVWGFQKVSIMLSLNYFPFEKW